MNATATGAVGREHPRLEGRDKVTGAARYAVEYPAEAVTYWEDRFAKLRASPSWKKYIEENQLDDHFTNSAELEKLIKQIEGELRTQYQAAGVKVVR